MRRKKWSRVRRFVFTGEANIDEYGPYHCFRWVRIKTAKGEKFRGRR